MALSCWGDAVGVDVGERALMAEPRLLGGCRRCCCFFRRFTHCCRDARSVEPSYGTVML